MAKRSVKATVEIDGEKKYKEALADLNKGNQVLASEMRKLQAQYKGNEDSTEALKAKGELLERQLLQQRDKVQSLREALANAAQQYGEADRRTQEWQIKLNNAEAAEYGLEHAIEANNTALEQQQDELHGVGSAFGDMEAEAAGIGDTIDDLAGKLGVNVPDAAKKALNGLGSFSSGAVTKLGLVVAIIAAIVAGIKKVNDVTKEAAADADELMENSMITGLSTQTLQELQYSENLIDVSVDTITGSMTKLTRSMASARDGNENMQKSFAALNIGITDADGQLRNTEETFYRVIYALGGVQNETERDALAMQLLGKSAQELNPLIIQGTGVLRERMEEGKKLGYVLSHDELQSLAAVDDAYQRLQLTIDTSRKQIALDFAPSSQKAFEVFSDAIKSATDILEKSGLADTLGLILSDILDILQNIVDVTNAIPGLDEGLGLLKITLGAVAQLCALIADVSDEITALFTLDWTKMKTALGFGYTSGNPSNYQRTVMIQDGTYQQYQDFYNSPAYTGYTGSTQTRGEDIWITHWDRDELNEGFYGSNASGNENWRGGLTYLGENGAETAILPQGTRILNAQETAQLGGGDTYNFNVEVRDLEDLEALIRWAKGARVRERMR